VSLQSLIPPQYQAAWIENVQKSVADQDSFECLYHDEDSNGDKRFVRVELRRMPRFSSDSQRFVLAFSEDVYPASNVSVTALSDPCALDRLLRL